MFIVTFQKTCRIPFLTTFRRTISKHLPNIAEQVHEYRSSTLCLVPALPKKSPRCQWCGGVRLRGVNGAAEFDSAVSMVRRSSTPRCQWCGGVRLRGVNGTAAEFDSAVSMVRRSSTPRCQCWCEIRLGNQMMPRNLTLHYQRCLGIQLPGVNDDTESDCVIWMTPRSPFRVLNYIR
jgi:hypothetical protein